MHDIIIIGAGMSGMSAALTAVKLKLKTLLVAKEFSVLKVGATELNLFDAKKMQKELVKVTENSAQFFELYLKQEVTSLEKNVISFSVETKSGQTFYAKSVIICSGENSVTHEGNTAFDLTAFKDFKNKIKVDAQMATNVPGLFAGGSVLSGAPGNSVTSVGEGSRAVLSAKVFLKS